MPFDLTILGSGAALPTAARNATSQYLNCNERHILIDCGEGTQHQLRHFGVKFQKIKYILISHLHGDHYFGLIGLLSTMNLLGRTQAIHLFAPVELEEIIAVQLKASGHHFGFDLIFKALDTKEEQVIFEDRLIQITSFPLRHRIPTCGFQIKEKPKPFTIDGERFREDQVSLEAIPYFQAGKDFVRERVYAASEYTFPPKPAKSYAYFSDTAIAEENLKYAQGVDLLYHEATFLNQHVDRAHKTRHSTAEQAAKFAAQAQVKKLLLGHISSRYEDDKGFYEEASVFFKEVHVVSDGDEFSV